MLSKKNKILKYDLPIYLWATIMLTLSSVPGEKIPEIHIWSWDKFAHAFEYLVLSFFIYRRVLLIDKISIRNAQLISFTIGVIFGVLDEFHQLLIPNRCSSFADAIADSTGVLLGIILFTIILKRKKRNA